LPADQRRNVPLVQGAYKAITLEAGDLWYGYIYANNPTKRGYVEKVTPKMKGLHVTNKVANE